MTVHISGQVPGEQQNGVVEIEAELLKERTPDPIVAVVIIERAGLKFTDAKQVWEATIMFRHIEPLVGEAAAAARGLLEKRYAERTGNAPLPIELDVDGEGGTVTDGPWAPDVDGAGDGPEAA